MDENRKINVAILFGGKSVEHEVSLRSAKNVVDAINKEKYYPILINIDKGGSWILNDALSQSLLSNCLPSKVKQQIDVVFPILHGPYGEDGTVQGLLKLANVPFVGSGVLGSAVGMDKDVMKRLLRDAGIPTGNFTVFRDADVINFKAIVDKLGLPLFVKPANAGSSVGVNKVKNETEFKLAIKNAFLYDSKIVVEECIIGREIECAVLGNDNPTASVCGEVIPSHEFYSYEAKYLDKHGAAFTIPANIPDAIAKKIQKMSVDVFQTLSGIGLARVDFFLTNENKVIVNEINTMPGFTSISMYPRLWEASGIAYSDLIDRLIQLAMERFEKDSKLSTSYVH